MRTESGLNRRGELRMIERAANQGWNPSQEARDRAVKLAADTLSDPHATPREKLAATRAMLAMENDNRRNQ